MWSPVAVRLLIINAALFMLILSVFSSAVYVSVINQIDTEQRRRLVSLTAAVKDSYLASVRKGLRLDKNLIPEILKSSAPAEDWSVSNGESLEWFDTDGKPIAQTGSLTVDVPFNKKADFQEQDDEHSLVLTMPVLQGDILCGYLRAGISLEDEDEYKAQLLTSLFFGSLLAIVVSSLGVVILVRQYLKQIEFNLQRLSQFTSDVSHELRSPLTAVKSNASVALRHEEGMRPGDREKFSAILAATNQMIRTTSDLLILAHAQENIDTGPLTPLDLSQLINEQCLALEATAIAKSIHLEKSVLPQLVINGNGDDLRRVFLNLFENAVQYTEPAGSITVRAQKHSGRAVVEIVDSGIGIGEEDLTKIFDRFWRSDKARSYRSGGNGLGLAIVRSIVEAHKGTIAVTSRVGKGSVFTVSLPLAKANAESNS